uniref:Uncharacterized protein n=1 Tax=Trypanosoma brucei TaxID=5691 RepID=Q583A0_9TRYP|nr:hypothetical protein, unlikely [Trypanosoma brucei]
MPQQCLLSCVFFLFCFLFVADTIQIAPSHARRIEMK